MDYMDRRSILEYGDSSPFCSRADDSARKRVLKPVGPKDRPIRERRRIAVLQNASPVHTVHICPLTSQLFLVEMGNQCCSHGFKLAFHHLIQIIQCHINAMICDAILREVIGADAL